MKHLPRRAATFNRKKVLTDVSSEAGNTTEPATPLRLAEIALQPPQQGGVPRTLLEFGRSGVRASSEL